MREWSFLAPLGTHTVAECPFSEVITMSRHLHAANIRTYLSQRALTDIRDSATAAPAAVDSTGRLNSSPWRSPPGRKPTGRDIYAVTAPSSSRRLDDSSTAAPYFVARRPPG